MWDIELYFQELWPRNTFLSLFIVKKKLKIKNAYTILKNIYNFLTNYSMYNYV